VQRSDSPTTATPLSAEAGPNAAIWFDVGADRVRLLRDGDEAFPAMLDAIANAEREVLLEIYWIGDDEVGRHFRDALVERARAGVKVRVLYDALGSLGVGEVWWQPLADAGGRTAWYHSISPFDPRFRFGNVELRDHRKLLVIDGRNGFTGGINLAEPWLPPTSGGRGWRDDMVEVRGEVVEELRSVFYRTWRRLTWERNPADVRRLSGARTRPVWVLAGRRWTRRSIHREYLIRIDRARRNVDIANSYFVPDRPVRNALVRAVRRGVQVRVLVPEKSDVAFVQFAVEATFESLLRNGIEIWRFPERMLHAKTAIIDETFTTIGTYNLDERSRNKNLEVNLAVENAAFARHVRESFEVDLRSAGRVDPEDWSHRPIARRAVEWTAFTLRRLL